jgi:phosphatidate cytidylyltransferase
MAAALGVGAAQRLRPRGRLVLVGAVPGAVRCWLGRLGWAAALPWGCCGWLVVAAWVLGSAWLLRAGVPGWPRCLPRCAGGGYCWPCAGLAGRGAGAGMGINFLLSVMCLVWMADIAAYFAGPLSGCASRAASWRPQHQPRQELGRACGVAWRACCCWPLLLGAVPMPSGSRFNPACLAMVGAGLVGLAGVATLFMTAMSVLGDLVESLIKRSAGRQGQQPAAARPWRRARPHGCLVAHFALGHDAGQQRHGDFPMKQRLRCSDRPDPLVPARWMWWRRHPDRFEVFALSAATQVDA